MSSTVLNAMNTIATDVHAVGSLNEWHKNVLNLGAIVDETVDEIDNWNLVTLDFDAQSGERVCKKLTGHNDPKPAYLLAAVEEYMGEYETIKNFFNAKGERVRVVKLEPGMRFECSNFSPNDAGTIDSTHPYKNGLTAHFDHTTGKFIVNNENTHGNYNGATNQFVIVDAVGNYLDGQKTMRFEVIK